MKILFVLENLADRCGANVNIAIVLAKQLSKSCEVHALVRYDDVKPVSDNKKEVFDCVRMFYADQAGKLAKFTSDDWNKAGKSAKILRLCKSPSTFVSMVDAKYYDFSITRRKCRKAVEKVCKKEKYNAVIAVSAPYYIMQAVAEANITSHKMALQLDPFTNNYTLTSRFKNRRRKIEIKTNKKLCAVFAGDYMYDDLITVVPNGNGDIVSTPLPGLICENMVEQAEKRKIDNKIDNKKVNFIFVGQFYEEIRNPHYLLELFTALPSSYILHIVGGGCDKEFEKYTQILGERLVRHGWVSKNEANAFIEQFDILINVNNTITNQLPSKIFEYISTGKPILNICKFDECLSRPYMDRYNNGISVVEKQTLLEDNVGKINAFVENHLNTVLGKDEILENFERNTDVYVAKLIFDKISQITDGDK